MVRWSDRQTTRLWAYRIAAFTAVPVPHNTPVDLCFLIFHKLRSLVLYYWPVIKLLIKSTVELKGSRRSRQDQFVLYVDDLPQSVFSRGDTESDSFVVSGF